MVGFFAGLTVEAPKVVGLLIGNSICFEGVEMVAMPTHRRFDDLGKLVKGDIRLHFDPPPYRRLDRPQRHFEGMHSRGSAASGRRGCHSGNDIPELLSNLWWNRTSKPRRMASASLSWRQGSCS